MYVFDVRLADADRGVNESLTIRTAQHPSETTEYLVTRLLAYCLEYTEGIAFSKGLSDPDEPAIVVRDLTGVLQAWIEVGAPVADRLHRAAKAAPSVTVYAHRGLDSLVARLDGERIHRATEIRLRAVDPILVSDLVARLDRRMSLDLTVSDHTLYVSLGDETLTGVLEERRLGGCLVAGSCIDVGRVSRASCRASFMVPSGYLQQPAESRTMNANSRLFDVFCTALGLMLCFASGSARAGEPRTPVSKSPTLAFACMADGGRVEYDSAAFVTKNPGPTYEDHSKHHVAMQQAFGAYLKQQYGSGGLVQCAQYDTLAEIEKWLQWRKEYQVGRNYQLVTTDWTYSGTVSAAEDAGAAAGGAAGRGFKSCHCVLCLQRGHQGRRLRQ